MELERKIIKRIIFFNSKIHVVTYLLARHRHWNLKPNRLMHTSIYPLNPSRPLPEKNVYCIKLCCVHVHYVNSYFFVSAREKARDEGIYNLTTETRTSLKTEFAFFQSYFVKVGEPSWSLIPSDSIQVQTCTNCKWWKWACTTFHYLWCLTVLFDHFAVQKRAGRGVFRQNCSTVCKWDTQDYCGFSFHHWWNPASSQKNGV